MPAHDGGDVGLRGAAVAAPARAEFQTVGSVNASTSSRVGSSIDPSLPSVVALSNSPPGNVRTDRSYVQLLPGSYLRAAGLRGFFGLLWRTHGI